MNYLEYRFLVLSDLYRIRGNTRFLPFLRTLIFGDAYRYNFWMRTCQFSFGHPALRVTLYPLAWIMLRHYTYKLGISIPYQTQIESGFYIAHSGGIVVNANSRIGKNCNLSHGVTLEREVAAETRAIQRSEKTSIPGPAPNSSERSRWGTTRRSVRTAS